MTTESPPVQQHWEVAGCYAAFIDRVRVIFNLWNKKEKKKQVKSRELKKETEMRQSAMKTDLATRPALYRAVPFIVTLWS